MAYFSRKSPAEVRGRKAFRHSFVATIKLPARMIRESITLWYSEPIQGLQWRRKSTFARLIAREHAQTKWSVKIAGLQLVHNRIHCRDCAAKSIKCRRSKTGTSLPDMQRSHMRPWAKSGQSLRELRVQAGFSARRRINTPTPFGHLPPLWEKRLA